VLEKWLKARILSEEGMTHYGKIVVGLRETIRLMAETDEIIPRPRRFWCDSPMRSVMLHT
jgi:hypothetical protein